MTSGLTVRGLRRLLADAEWAKARLRPFSGHQVSWDLAGLQGGFLLDAEGLPGELPGPEAADAEAAPVGSGTPTDGGTRPRGRPALRHARQSVHLHLAGEDLAALGGGMDALMRRVSIEGNAGLAAELAYIARHLRPDPAEWLAPYLGDVLAERADQTVRSGLQWGWQAAARGARQGGEFLVHEARLLPAAEQVAEHCRAVDDLREGVDRLGQRIARLEALARKHRLDADA